MIDALVGHLTDDQINKIVDIILEQYVSYISYSDSLESSDLFLEEYSSHRAKHLLSWAIVSAFPSNETVGGVFCVNNYKDEGGHTRPELYNDQIDVMILSSKTNFNSKYLCEKYKMNSNLSNERLFCYICFSESKDRLMKLELVLPDATGKDICRMDLKTKGEITDLSNYHSKEQTVSWYDH